MKISMSLLIVSSLGAGLMLTAAEKEDTATKSQLLLRQKMADLDGAASPLPTKEELWNDIQRLHREGKISNEQFEAFKKNINEQYGVPGAPATNEAQRRAQQVLDQKRAESRAQPAADSEAQAKAKKVLDQQLAAPATQKAGPPPTTTTGTLTPELEAKAREVLRAQTAEKQPKAEQAGPPPNNEAQA